MALFKIIVWTIIFFTKLRFPPGISIATVLLSVGDDDDGGCDGDVVW